MDVGFPGLAMNGVRYHATGLTSSKMDVGFPGLAMNGVRYHATGLTTVLDYGCSSQHAIILGFSAVRNVMNLLSMLLIASMSSAYNQGPPQEESSLFIYKEADSGVNSITCKIPSNITIPPEAEIEWIAPPGVLLKKGDARVDSGHMSGTWVQQTSNNTLIFHNPDDAVTGAYICRGRREGDVLYEWKVWVHVLGKAGVDYSYQLKVAFISVGVILVVVVLCLGSIYWYRKNKCRYGTGSKPNTRNTFIIPTINVVDMSESVTMLENSENCPASEYQLNNKTPLSCHGE
ncbi:hypothetical protein Btru_004329 [Bulinus truncatus]|nr:hypothetical protein Btru_004329 [Bulinus truncatus]